MSSLKDLFKLQFIIELMIFIKIHVQQQPYQVPVIKLYFGKQLKKLIFGRSTCLMIKQLVCYSGFYILISSLYLRFSLNNCQKISLFYQRLGSQIHQNNEIIQYNYLIYNQQISFPFCQKQSLK
ncbi:hypothetical protein pb186bvf_009522 [Paramecium bursaria]